MNSSSNLKKINTLRLVTCGSVDDGKSTLLGRLIASSQALSDDQWERLQADSKRHGKAGKGNIDYALLVDGLEAEVAQGITIDVAYRYFSSAKRTFIVADSPGHIQYTRNMVTAASNADIGLLLVDASLGLSEQSRRHLFILHLMGIAQVVVAINKMDLVDYDQARFQRISAELEHFAQKLGVRVTIQPVAAREGSGITSDKLEKMPWWQGKSLLETLETIELIQHRIHQLGASMWVQGIMRPDEHYRAYMGSVSDAAFKQGDEITVLPTGQRATIKSLQNAGKEIETAASGLAINLLTDRELDISRGDLIVNNSDGIIVAQRVSATLVWMDEEPLHVGRRYRMRLGTHWVDATITRIESTLDLAALDFQSEQSVSLNTIAKVQLDTETPIAFRPYSQSKTLGAFIIVDRVSKNTAAAGMLDAATASDARVPHRKQAKSEHNNTTSTPQMLWLTGLPKSGKSALAQALAAQYSLRNQPVYVLDFDNIRLGLNRDLGFSDDDRVEHLRRVAEVGRLLVEAGVNVIAAFISPFAHERRSARSTIGEAQFKEIYLDTSLACCEQRDSQGQYARARAGKLAWVPGVNVNYDIPSAADVHLDGDCGDSPEQLAIKVFKQLDL